MLFSFNFVVCGTENKRAKDGINIRRNFDQINTRTHANTRERRFEALARKIRDLLEEM